MKAVSQFRSGKNRIKVIYGGPNFFRCLSGLTVVTLDVRLVPTARPEVENPGDWLGCCCCCCCDVTLGGEAVRTPVNSDNEVAWPKRKIRKYWFSGSCK